MCRKGKTGKRSKRGRKCVCGKELKQGRGFCSDCFRGDGVGTPWTMVMAKLVMSNSPALRWL